MEEHPRLRPVEIIPFEADGQRMFLLRDRLGIGPDNLVLSPVAALVAGLLDGSRTLAGVRAALQLRVGLAPPEEQLAAFVAQLDQLCLLEGDGFARRLAELRAAFDAAASRPAVHAGRAYPDDPERLSTFLEAQYYHPEGPGAPPNGPVGPALAGLIAPHVDLHRGGPTYAWAYRALAESPPADRYVILGTCHTPMETAFAATAKPYETPLGPVPCDREFLDALAARYGDLYRDEFSHRSEHSIEFQALYLRYLGLAGDGRAPIVPVLCNSPQAPATNGESAGVRPEVADFVAALRETIARSPGRTCLIAGADLAHVGQQFGDPFLVDPVVLRRVEQGDREMLDFVCRGDAEGFYAQVMADQDARKICGLGPIYTLLATLGPASGRLLKYTQWADPSGFSSVTFASVAFPDE